MVIIYTPTQVTITKFKLNLVLIILNATYTTYKNILAMSA